MNPTKTSGPKTHFQTAQKQTQKKAPLDSQGVQVQAKKDPKGQNSAPKKLTHYSAPGLLAVLGVDPDTTIRNTDTVLWDKVLAAMPSPEGIPTYPASNDLNQLRVPDGSPLPQLLMEVLLAAGETSAACALVRMCNRRTRIEPLCLLLKQTSGKRIEEFLPDKKDRQVLRAALPGTARYLFRQGSRKKFFELVALCPTELKAMVVARSLLRPPLLNPNANAEVLVKLEPQDWRDAMEFAVQDARNSTDASEYLKELAKLVDPLYDGRSVLPLEGAMAVELNDMLLRAVSELKLEPSVIQTNLPPGLVSSARSFWNVEGKPAKELDELHEVARRKLESIGITSEVGGAWKWSGTLPLKEGWEEVLFTYVRTATSLGPAYVYLAARLFESCPDSVFVLQGLVDHAASALGRRADIARFVNRLVEWGGPQAEATATILFEALLNALPRITSPLSAEEFDSLVSYLPADLLSNNLSGYLAKALAPYLSATDPADSLKKLKQAASLAPKAFAAIRTAREMFCQKQLKAANIEFVAGKGWVVHDPLPQGWEGALFAYIAASPNDHGPLWKVLFDQPEREQAIALALVDRLTGSPQPVVVAVHEALGKLPTSQRYSWLRLLRQLESDAAGAALVSGGSPAFSDIEQSAITLACSFGQLISSDEERRPATVDFALDVVGPAARLLIEKLEKTPRNLGQGNACLTTYMQLAGLCGEPYLSLAGRKFEEWRRVTPDPAGLFSALSELAGFNGQRYAFNFAKMFASQSAALFDFLGEALGPFAMLALGKAPPGLETSAMKQLVAEAMTQLRFSPSTFADLASYFEGTEAILAFRKAMVYGHYITARDIAEISVDPDFRAAALAAVDRAEQKSKK